MTITEKAHVAHSQIRLAAYSKLFGEEPTSSFSFPDADHPIEVLAFTLELHNKPFVVAVTSGMSDSRMVNEERNRLELIQYLQQCDEAHARRLRDMAWLPLFDRFFLDVLHTINWSYAAVEGSPWRKAFFLEPILKPHRNFRFTIDGDEVSFLWHIPISDEEHAYKLEFGANALVDLMEEKNMPWIFDENNRTSLC